MAALSRIPPRMRSVLRIAAALAVVAGTAAVVGLGRFLEGLASISPATILAAPAPAPVATAAPPWRWPTASGGFGRPLSRTGAS